MAEHQEHGQAQGGQAEGGGEHGGHDDHGKGGHKKHGGHGHGGHEEHEEGVPEWMISFADNALLQMGMFVIMFAMNVGEKAKGPTTPEEKTAAPAGVLDAMISLREAFGNPVSLNSTDPKDLPLQKRMKEKLQKGEGQDDGVKGENQNVQAPRPTGYAQITATITFEQDDALLSSDDKEVLISAAGRLRGQRWIVDVRGHCSSVEARGGGGGQVDTEKAMRLSYERAMAVAAFLAEQGIKWNQIRLSAAGDSDRRQPLAFDSAAHRTNQRVEVIVTNDPIAADPHTKDAAGER